MNIDEVLKELDSLPGGDEAYKTFDFLKEKIDEAHAEGDHSAELTLINEMIGYCRYTGRHEDSAFYGDYAVRLCEEQGLSDSLPYATSLLNIATADRAAGRLKESMKGYKKVEALYDKLVKKGDYLYAALYNNMSLLYQEMDDHKGSARYLEAALNTIDGLGGERVPQAITRTNLAQAYLRLGNYGRAEDLLKEAEAIFEELGGDEFHYPGCLNALGQLYYEKKDYAKSREYYSRALKLLKQHVGEDNPAYISVASNLKMADGMAAGLGDTDRTEEKDLTQDADRSREENMTEGADRDREENLTEGADPDRKENLTEVTDPGREENLTENITVHKESYKNEKINGMELSRRFYEEFGRDMLETGFPEYRDRITVGLVGRGSQCYGYDDELSTDHDYGPDFCIFLDDDLFYSIGDELQKAYDDLPGEYMGYKRVTLLPPDGRRVGVIRTREFYSRILEVDEDFLGRYVEAASAMDPECGSEVNETKTAIYGFFAAVKEENLSACTNGEIFKEGEGDFIRIRKLLSYYPDIIWRRRIAEELHYSAQMGQYNYIRMLKRGEKVASEIALAGYMEHTMKLVYLINRKYAPYYKWLHHGMADLEKAAVIMDIFNAVYDMPKGDERIRMTTEIVAAIIIEELDKIGMTGNVPKEEKFLDVYSQMMMRGDQRTFP